MASLFSVASLAQIIPQPIQALSGLGSIGKHDSGDVVGARNNVADAVYALEQMVATTVAFVALYKLTGGLSVNAALGNIGNILKTAALAGTCFIASPSTCQVALGAFLGKEGGLRAYSLYKNAAESAIATYASTAGYLVAGLALLSKATPISQLLEKNRGYFDIYIFNPLAEWTASKLVTVKTN